MGNPMQALLNGSGPLTQQTAANNPGVERAVKLYRTFQAAQNPAAMLQQMTAQNPVLAQIRQMGNPQQAFYAMCQQSGVDPQTILSQFQ